MGDGSNDRSLREQEAVVHRFLGLDGKPFNTFADLAELDLKDSVDGHSPDSQCITACYAKSFAALNGPVGKSIIFGGNAGRKRCWQKVLMAHP